MLSVAINLFECRATEVFLRFLQNLGRQPGGDLLFCFFFRMKTAPKGTAGKIWAGPARWGLPRVSDMAI